MRSKHKTETKCLTRSTVVEQNPRVVLCLVVVNVCAFGAYETGFEVDRRAPTFGPAWNPCRHETNWTGWNIALWSPCVWFLLVDVNSVEEKKKKHKNIPSQIWQEWQFHSRHARLRQSADPNKQETGL